MKRCIILLFSIFIIFNSFAQSTNTDSEQSSVVLYTEKYTIPDSNIQATKKIIKNNKDIYQMFGFPIRDRVFFFYHINDSDYSYEWLEVLATIAYETIQIDKIEWDKFCTRIAVLDNVQVENKNNKYYYYVEANDFMFTDWYKELVPRSSTVLEKYQYLWK